MLFEMREKKSWWKIGMIALFLLLSFKLNAQTQLYIGASTSGSDIAYTISGGKVYHGDGKFVTNVMFTIRNNQVFIGNSTMSFDCLYTIKDDKIYRGDSNFSSDMRKAMTRIF